MANKTGILICGHGSRAPKAAEEFAAVAAAIAARRPDFDLEGATGAGPIGALVAAFTFGALLLLGWRMRRAPRDEATASDDEATDDASDGELERALDRELARFDEA